MRIERILVVGGTGLIGRPVARQLLADGQQVRVLAADPGRARTELGAEFEYASGSVTDTAAVDRAIAGVDAVHVSLGVEDPTQLDAVEHRLTASVAATAARHGVERISYLTGSLVREPCGPKIPEHRVKPAAEHAIQESGVPHTFFRPTYFTNTLPRHVQGRLLVALGRQRQALHPVCAEDFAISRDASRRQRPQTVTSTSTAPSSSPCTTRSTPTAESSRPTSDWSRSHYRSWPRSTEPFMGGKLAPNLQVMRLLASLGKRCDATRPSRPIQAPLDPRSHIHCRSSSGLDARQSQRCLPPPRPRRPWRRGCDPALALQRRPPALA
jgi:NAD(P)H-binding